MSQVPRYARRFRCTFALSLSAGDCLPHPAEACDISTLGLAVHLSRAAVTAMARVGSQLNVGDPVSIRFPQPSGGRVHGSAPSVSARVCHIRRVSRDAYHVGFRFEDPSALPDAEVDRLTRRGA